jgi:hypothetical protein
MKTISWESRSIELSEEKPGYYKADYEGVTLRVYTYPNGEKNTTWYLAKVLLKERIIVTSEVRETLEEAQNDCDERCKKTASLLVHNLIRPNPRIGIIGSTELRKVLLVFDYEDGGNYINAIIEPRTAYNLAAHLIAKASFFCSAEKVIVYSNGPAEEYQGSDIESAVRAFCIRHHITREETDMVQAVVESSDYE